MKYWWLVENFTAEGHSTGLYMACQVNMTLTADVHKARKFRRQRTAEFRALRLRCQIIPLPLPLDFHNLNV